jgi:lipopolysaccharide export system protein LptA
MKTGLSDANCSPIDIASAMAGVALSLLLALSSAPALAEKADKQKPVNVEADKMQYDDIKQINVFSGNVRLTKGSIVITGDRVVVKQDPEGFQHGTALGNPATFRQKREGVDQYVEGCGSQLEYDGKTEIVKFTDKAQLKRYEGDRLTDEVYGTTIVYESLSEFFTVDSRTGAKREIPGRVKVIIQPKVEGEPIKVAPVVSRNATSLKSATALAGNSGPAQAAKCR